MSKTIDKTQTPETVDAPASKIKTVSLLSEAGVNPANILINDDVILILDSTDDELNVSAEFDGDKYTTEEIQEFADEILRDIMENAKNMEAAEIEAMVEDETEGEAESE